MILKEKEILEKKLNTVLKYLFYKQDAKEDDKKKDEAYEIVCKRLKNLSIHKTPINTERKSENIIKLQNEFENGKRIHIFIKKCDLISKDDKTFVARRKSLEKEYQKILDTCDFENDECCRTWYALVC